MAHHRPAEPREQMSPQERAETRERSMALLRQMLRPHRGALVLSIISVLLVSGSAAVVPILIARVLDSSIEPLRQGDASPLLTLLAFFCGGYRGDRDFFVGQRGVHGACVAGCGGVPA